MAAFTRVVAAQNNSISINTSSSNSVCPTGTVAVSGTVTIGGPATVWSWTVTPSAGTSVSPSVTSQSVTISFASAGTYTLDLSSSDGTLTATATQTVLVHPAATAVFTANMPSSGVPATVSFTNSSTNATSYLWNFGDSPNNLSQIAPAASASNTYTVAGSYFVNLIAYDGVNGCNDTTIQSITIIDTSGIKLPNIFSPNGDGINETFKPIIQGLKSLECVIYDRYGVKVADFNRINGFWDGHTTGGIAATEGTYFYVISGEGSDGKSFQYKGFIQLVR